MSTVDVDAGVALGTTGTDVGVGTGADVDAGTDMGAGTDVGSGADGGSDDAPRRTSRPGRSRPSPGRLPALDASTPGVAGRSERAADSPT
ncbi:hypothetical protein [Streptomyces sp. KLOTTS4A1]|uniref:hypothetical protein n=1 Tax=Streptomyces sp. KLOTTS4A1 TaxID=3390996 RepID=UPI0039F4E781